MQDPAPIPPALFSQEAIDHLRAILKKVANASGRATPPDPDIDARLRSYFGTSYLYLLNEKTRRLRRPAPARTRKAFTDIQKSTAKILAVLDKNPTAKECFSRALLYAPSDAPLGDFAGKDFIGIMRQLDEFVRLAPVNLPPPKRPHPKSMETLDNVATRLGYFYKQITGENPTLNDQGPIGKSKKSKPKSELKSKPRDGGTVITHWYDFASYFIKMIREHLPQNIANEITPKAIERACAEARTAIRNASPR